MSIHAYDRSALMADGARGVGGLALAGLPVLAGDMPTEVIIPLALIALVFALYAIAVFRRTLSRVELNADGIVVQGPWPTRLAWSEVERLRLAYYSTRRDGRAGWMQLSLTGTRARIVIDSRISDFVTVTRRAVGAAEGRALRLDPATLANLHQLGIDVQSVPVNRGAACGAGVPS